MTPLLRWGRIRPSLITSGRRGIPTPLPLRGRTIARRRSGVRGLASVAILILAGGCSGTSEPPKHIPSAKGCAPSSGAVVRIYIYADGTVQPACLEVQGTQQLEVFNMTNEPSQYKATLDVSLPGYPPLHLLPGRSARFAGPVGSHLSQGANDLHVSPLGSTAEVWLSNA